jgi:hypothetical protein
MQMEKSQIENNIFLEMLNVEYKYMNGIRVAHLIMVQ